MSSSSVANPWFLVGLAVSAGMWFYAFVYQPYPTKLFNVLDINDKVRTLILLPGNQLLVSSSRLSLMYFLHKQTVTLLIFYLTSVGYTIFWLFGAIVAGTFPFLAAFFF